MEDLVELYFMVSFDIKLFKSFKKVNMKKLLRV